MIIVKKIIYAGKRSNVESMTALANLENTYDKNILNENLSSALRMFEVSFVVLYTDDDIFRNGAGYHNHRHEFPGVAAQALPFAFRRNARCVGRSYGVRGIGGGGGLTSRDSAVETRRITTLLPFQPDTRPRHARSALLRSAGRRVTLRTIVRGNATLTDTFFAVDNGWMGCLCCDRAEVGRRSSRSDIASRTACVLDS